MTRSHANKATFSPPFLHPLSPSTAMNATPPTTDHTGRPGDMEGGTRWAYKVRPLFLFFIFYFTYFDSTPSSPNMFPSTENAPTCHSCRPQLTRDVPHPPNIPNTRTCPCGHVLVFPLPLPRFEHLSSPLPVSNTRTCPHRHVLVLAHLPSPSPSSRTPEQARVWLILVLVHLRSSFLSSQASEQAHTGSVLTHLSSPYPSSQTPERAHM